MSEYEMRLIIERERRNLLTQQIIAWESANGIMLMPIPRPGETTRPRIEQLVDEAMSQKSQGGKQP